MLLLPLLPPPPLLLLLLLPPPLVLLLAPVLVLLLLPGATGYLWSSKLATLSEALEWFQALPDLDPTVTGMSGLGTSELTISLSADLTPETRERAQNSFNLGLRNLHAFSPFESMRHFSRCLQVRRDVPKERASKMVLRASYFVCHRCPGGFSLTLAPAALPPLLSLFDTLTRSRIRDYSVFPRPAGWVLCVWAVGRQSCDVLLGHAHGDEMGRGILCSRAGGRGDHERAAR